MTTKDAIKFYGAKAIYTAAHEYMSGRKAFYLAVFGMPANMGVVNAVMSEAFAALSDADKRADYQDAAATLGKLGGSAKSAAKAAAVRENGKLGGRPALIRITGGGSTGFGFYVDLSNGDRLTKKTTCNPAAYDQLVSDVVVATNRTQASVKRALKKYIS